MIHLRYKPSFALSFFTLLATSNDIAIAKDAKRQEDVPPSAQKHVDIQVDMTDKKSKIQSELEAENSFNRALLEKKLAGIVAQIEQLRLEKERKKLNKEIEEEALREAHDKAMRSLSMEKEKLILEIELEQARFMKQMGQYNIQIAELERKTQLEKGHVQLLQENKNRLQAEIDSLKINIEREKHLTKKPVYLKDPLRKRDNVLVLSDRCIELTGVILPWKANYIVDQIQYFNNKDSNYPIFIIITASPGGSVAAGWNILQAIKHSKAPVYVVVKDFAASMAAVITTLATKSYAYPNAKILYHEPSCSPGLLAVFFGMNLRQAEEFSDRLRKVWQRLGDRVAKKMGISLSDFNKKLYQKSIYGDWEEYADEAKKLHWVDCIVNGIEDSALNILPDSLNYTLEKYIKDFYSFEQPNNMTLSAEEMRYYASAPHDFDYSYRPHSKIQKTQTENK